MANSRLYAGVVVSAIGVFLVLVSLTQVTATCTNQLQPCTVSGGAWLQFAGLGLLAAGPFIALWPARESGERPPTGLV
jgi:hypothetical protein